MGASSAGFRRRRDATRFWRSARSALMRLAGRACVDQGLGQDLVHGLDRHDPQLRCGPPPARRPGPSRSACGMRTVLTPARCAASSLLFSPPMGSTRPRSVISPVMARSRRTGSPGEQAGHGGGHGHAGRRAVLGGRPRRNVDVHGLLLEDGRVDPELLGPCPDVAQPGARRLLHHVAQLAGQDEVVLAVHPSRLDLHDVATGVADHQAGGHADLVLCIQLAVVEAGRAEVVLQLLRLDGDARPCHRTPRAAPPCAPGWRSRAPGCGRRPHG